MPVEGRFEPLLQRDLLHAFSTAGAERTALRPRIPQHRPRRAPAYRRSAHGTIPFPSRGTLLAPDHSFLFTVDWDSFFTLFYSSRAFITRVAAARNIEGFFATPNTEHAWYNYSFGCATITLSPEHWQTV